MLNTIKEQVTRAVTELLDAAALQPGDLLLCGHTHRGQIFPGSLITDRMYTVDYGYYRADDASPQVIVSSGVGTWGMPMRVGTDCEIVKINLHS